MLLMASQFNELLIDLINYEIIIFTVIFTTKTRFFRGLVRQRTIPTERQPLVGEVSANLADSVCRVVSATNPHGR
jgi:hypothetical protein